MAVPIRGSHRGARLLPGSLSGWISCGVFGFSILLVVLPPAFGIPPTYWPVIVALAASGLIGVIAVALAHERSVGVFITLLLGLVAGAFLLAEALGGSSPNQTLTLGESANGKTLTVSAKTSILLQLPGNPSTGYDWEVTIGNPSVLDQSTWEFTPSSTALGAGGTYSFWFQPKASGRTDVTLVYRRSWETGVAPLKTYKITIAVQ